jgi:predicted deacetylase
MVHDHPDEQFWDKARLWQQKGYRLALHGCSHVYANTNSGIIGMNKRSEFAGVALDQQKRMLTKGVRKFKEEGIVPEIFVAPAHSFDKNTLIALKDTTNIRIISDGFYMHPVHRFGLNWIPQQLWEPAKKSNGVWTVCCHPEISDHRGLEKIGQFINAHNSSFVDPLSLHFTKRKLNDRMYFLFRKNYFRIRDKYYALLKGGNAAQTNHQSS